MRTRRPRNNIQTQSQPRRIISVRYIALFPDATIAAISALWLSPHSTSWSFRIPGCFFRKAIAAKASSPGATAGLSSSALLTSAQSTLQFLHRAVQETSDESSAGQDLQIHQNPDNVGHSTSSSQRPDDKNHVERGSREYNRLQREWLWDSSYFCRIQAPPARNETSSLPDVAEL